MNSIFFDELYRQYAWYDSFITPIIKECSKEFFFDGFEYKLLGISTNMNILSQNETFFVTKVKINSKNDVYLRISQDGINVIFDRVLGKNNRRFDLTEVTELEARIMTAFNDSLYEGLAGNFTIEPHRRYSEILHFTYYVKSEASDNSAKLIISIPKDILSPKEIETSNPKFTDEDFANSDVEVNLLVGTTSFPVADVKKLDIGDIVVFENSNSSKMTLKKDNILQEFEIRPNEKIIEPYDTDEGEDMQEDMNTNLWDSIQVDMSAEFDKVKITLGELKNIEEGLVVDLCSVYDNKISLKVGSKLIATGELVIINDRYGVKIDKLNEASNSGENNQMADNQQDATDNSEENFDYSDFENE